jgi:hypothetical protein
MTSSYTMIVASTALLALMGCSRSTPTTTFGEPIAIRMEAENGPPYVLVVVAPQGEDLRAAVGNIASVVHLAIKVCPGSVPSSPTAPPSTVQASTTETSLQMEATSSATAAESCLARELTGKPLRGFRPKSSYVLQIRHPGDKEIPTQ